MKPKTFLIWPSSSEGRAASITACGDVFARVYAASVSSGKTSMQCKVAATEAVEHFVKVLTEEVY